MTHMTGTWSSTKVRQACAYLFDLGVTAHIAWGPGGDGAVDKNGQPKKTSGKLIFFDLLMNSLSYNRQTNNSELFILQFLLIVLSLVNEYFENFLFTIKGFQ